MRDPSFYLGAAAFGAGLAGWLAWLITPHVRTLAIKYGAAHAPRSRDVHREPVPRWGGLAIFAAFVLALLGGALLVQFFFHRHIETQTWLQGAGLILAGAILSIVGAIDDRWELSAGKQIIVQIACAALVIPFGVEIRFLSNPFGSQMIDLQWLSYPVTILWLVGVANAVNWIDGIDGLAAGVTAIAACSMALLAAWSKQPALALLAAALFGALAGFLRYNFNPAKIFMGGGAQVVGFLLAGVSAVGAFKVPMAAAMALPILILALPIFDTATVIVRRWRAGRPIYQADKSHLHHRLLELGYSQRQTVLILYGISFSLCLVALGTFVVLTVRG